MISRARGSVADDIGSSVSRRLSMSSRSIVASLSKQLQEEKDARLKLEQELEQLKVISTEIAKNLSKK